MYPPGLIWFQHRFTWAGKAAHPRQRPADVAGIPIPSCAATAGMPLTISVGDLDLTMVPTPPGDAVPGTGGLGGISGETAQPGTPGPAVSSTDQAYYCAFTAFSIMFQNMPGISPCHMKQACHIS